MKIPDVTINKAAKIATKSIGKDAVRIPNTSYGFEADLNSLKRTEEELYAYISHIPPTLYSKFYKTTDINADFLMIILNSILKYETSSDKILDLLYNFSLTNNFSMTVMFFNDSDRQVFNTLLDKAKGADREGTDMLVKKIQQIIGE